MFGLIPQFSQSLQKVQKAEQSLWSLLANSAGWSYSDLQGCPINGIALGVLRDFFKEDANLTVGVIPFCVRNFHPLTAEAYNSGCQTFAETLLWAGKQDSFPPEAVNSALQAFVRKYLVEVNKLATISSVGAQVCFGIDHATARALLLSDFDRWTAEIFVRHFQPQFSLIGADESLREDFRDPVQSAFVDWLMAPPKQKNVQRNKFLRTAFRFTDLPAGKHQPQDFALQQEDARQVLACCAAFGVALPTAQRLLQLYGLEEKAAYNLARRSLRRSQPRNSLPHLSRSKRETDQVQICRLLMNRALDSSYTTTTLIEAFIWASLASVQIVRLGPVQGYEGFWVTWIEKRMQGYLRMLAALPDNLCGADEFCSAKDNVLGEHDDAA